MKNKSINNCRRQYSLKSCSILGEEEPGSASLASDTEKPSDSLAESDIAMVEIIYAGIRISRLKTMPVSPKLQYV